MKRRMKRLIAYVLIIALSAGSLLPAGTVYASEVPTSTLETVMPTNAPEGTAPATEAPASTPTETTPATEVPASTPTETTPATEVPTSIPMETSPAPEVPTSTPMETVLPTEEPSATPEALPEPLASLGPEVAETASASPLVSAETDATSTPDYILGRPMTEEEKAYQEALVPAAMPNLPAEEVVESYDGMMTMYARVPETYDAREYGLVTAIKNQNPYGSCWTFGAIASMESSLLSQGVTSAESLDLSEWHLAYFATHTGGDALGNTAEDYVKELDGTGYMDNGGNIQMAAVALANWKGAAPESSYPVTTDRSELASAGEALTAADAYQNNSYYLDECYMVPSTDREEIKKLIQAVGAVYGSYYHGNAYYNAETAAYYCEKTSTNHAITIVGWDDAYSRANFVYEPAQDGAWICKNSWGSGFGDEGYFYISYYDASLCTGNVAAFVGKEIEEDLHNYYYGGGVNIATYAYTTGIAQCFSAKANPEGAEEVVGTGFLTYDAGVGYSVQVYKNPKMTDGAVTNPASGEAMFSEPQQGVTTYAGYHSVTFENPVTVAEGDVFAVVITFDETVRILMDATHTLKNGSAVVYDSINRTEPGESFSRPEGYTTFISLHSEDGNGYTPRMNVFTKDTEREITLKAYVLSGEEKTEIGSYYTWEEAVAALMEVAEEGKDYLFTLLQDTVAGATLPMPEGIGSLTVEGTVKAEENGTLTKLEIRGDAAEEWSAASDLTLQNVALLALKSKEKLEAFTIRANGHTITLKDEVSFDRPVKLIGDGGSLVLDGAISSVKNTASLAGSIGGFADVTIASAVTLCTYETADEETVGGSLSADKLVQKADFTACGDLNVKEYLQEGGSIFVSGQWTCEQSAGFYGDSDMPVQAKAGRILFTDVTLAGASIAAEQDFVIQGIVVSESDNNRLVTVQKVNEQGRISDIYLTLQNVVVLSDEANRITVQVKTPDGSEDARLDGAPAACGLLVRAPKAEATCFAPAAENYADELPRTVKEDTGIYVYYAKDVPVEVTKEEDGEVSSLGYFADFAQATACVEALKNKDASYIFTLHDSLGSKNAVKLSLPSYASEITIRKAETIEEPVIRLAANITLKTDTVLEHIIFEPAFGSKSLTIQMGNHDLTMKQVTMAPSATLSKIVADNKSKACLTVTGDAEALYTYEIGNGGLLVPVLCVKEKVALSVAGKMTAGDLLLAEGSTLLVNGKGSVITNVTEYTPVDFGKEASLLQIGQEADLTIQGTVSAFEEGALAVEKEGTEAVSGLSKLTRDNCILKAKQAFANRFAVQEQALTFKHEQGIYRAPAEAVQTGLLQGKLSAEGQEDYEVSYFIDWYQMVTEISRIGQAEDAYRIELLGDSTVCRRLDAAGKESDEPGTLLMPTAGSCKQLLVEGGGHKLAYSKVQNVRTDVILRNVKLAPQKKQSGSLVWTPVDLTINSGKNGTRLVLDAVAAAEDMMPDEDGQNTLFRHIKGEGKKAVLSLQNGSKIAVRGNVTGLTGFYLGMSETGDFGGSAAATISGNLQTKTLGIWGEDTEILTGTMLVVTGKLQAEALAGEHGILCIRQTSAKKAETLAKVAGISEYHAEKPLTVLVLQPEITELSVYNSFLASGRNPFVPEVVDIPLLQAPAMSAECVRTAFVTMQEEDILLTLPEDVIYYKDTGQYIRAGQKTEMSIRIVAISSEGRESVSYGANWFECMQMLSRMGNHYAGYRLELLESTTYLTGYSSKKKTEIIGKLSLPAKVKGRIEIVCAEGAKASLAYSGELKVPAQQTVVINGVPFTCVNASAKAVEKRMTIAGQGTLVLKNVSESCQDISKITAPKGNLELWDTSLQVSGNVNVKELYVNQGENKIRARSSVQIGVIEGAEENGGSLTLETVGKYQKSGKGYKKTNLSQVSFTGRIGAEAEVKLCPVKDTEKEPEGAETSYTLAELLAASAEIPSAAKKLGSVSGNVADGRILIVDEAGESYTKAGEAYLVTAQGGLYLTAEKPIIKVISSGGSTDDYIGSFADLEGALQAVAVSVKKDTSFAKDNQKEYRILFLEEPQESIACKLPSVVTRLVIVGKEGEEAMPLFLTGNVSYGKKGGRIVFEDIAVTMVTKSAKLAVSNLELCGASVETTGDVVLQNAVLTEASLVGRNITVSERAALEGGILSATADAGSATGKLKLNRLEDLRTSKDHTNRLEAKVNKNGLTQMEIRGIVDGQASADRTFANGQVSADGTDMNGQSAADEWTAGFEVALYQNNAPDTFVTLAQGSKLIKAPKAGSGFFSPVYSTDEKAGMVLWQENFGVYKKGSYLCYGDLASMEAVLYDESLQSDAGSSFASLEEAVSEISIRKNKKASYHIVLKKDAMITNQKGAYQALTLPSYAKSLIIEGATVPTRDTGFWEEKLGANEDGVTPNSISFQGKLSPKCKITLKNIALKTYKRSGAAYTQAGTALQSSKYPVTVSGKAAIWGDMTVEELVLTEGADLYLSQTLSAGEICYAPKSRLIIEKDKPISLGGALTGDVAGEKLTIMVNRAALTNGTKVMMMKFFFKKAQLQKIRVTDSGGAKEYKLYQDGRAVFART